MKKLPISSRPNAALRSWIEPLEARIAPANFDLSPFNGQGPFTLEVDPLDSHIHIVSGAAGEIFDQGVGPGDNLFVTGGGAADAFIIANSAGGNVAFSGTLSVTIPGPINVTAPAGTGLDLVLNSTGANITYSTSILLGTSAAHFTAARNISFTNGSVLSASVGDIMLSANQGVGQNGTFAGISLDATNISTTGVGKIQFTSTGGNVGSNNAGISMVNGSVISSTSNLPTAGTIDLLGKGGAGLANNQGIFMAGASTQITSASGAISVTGLGAGNGAGNNVGVLLSNGARIVSTGTGVNAATITVNGTGGGGNDFNHGVFLDGSGLDPRITSIDGNIQVTGTALATPIGQGSRGISIEQGGQILASGLASLTLNGTGGSGTSDRQGILVSGAGSVVRADNGAVNLTGTGGAGAAGGSNNGVLVTSSGGVSALGVGPLTITGTEGGGVGSEGISVTVAGSKVESAAGSGLSLIANNINLAPAVVIDGGTGLVTLKPLVPGTLINVGGADVPTNVLGLTNAELVQITAGTIVIGDNTSGPIGITAALNFNHNLILTSNGAVTDGSVLALTGGSSLTINATNGIDLSASVDVSGGTASFASGPGVAINVNNAANNFGTVTIPNGATVSLRDDGGFNLGAVNVSTQLSVESAGVISQSGPISGAGGLTKLGGGTLVLSSANTYGGTTTISAGILQVGDNGTTGTLGSGPVTDNASLVFARSDAHTINNAISGNGVVQNSVGTVTLGGNNTYTGSTTVTGGTLLVTGQLANTAFVTVATPGTLGGTGTISAPLTIAGGVSPGGSPGTLGTGNVTFQAASRFTVEINGAFPAHDQLAVTGTVSLGGATLTTSGSIASVPGQQIVLIANDGNDPVIGTFAGLAEGAPVDVNGVTFNLTYVGGSNGNDVVLAQPAATTEVVFIGSELSINDIVAGGRDDSITLSMNAAGTILTITDPGAIFTAATIQTATVSADLHTVTVPAAVFGITPIRVLAGSGDDTVTVDYTQGNFANGISFFGGANGIIGDKIAITGGPSTPTSTIDFSASDAGSLTFFDTSRIDYLGAEAVDVDRVIGIAGLTYRFFAGQTINISDAGGSKTNVISTAAARLTIRHPTTALGIVGGAFSADIFNLNSLAANFPGTLSLDGDAGADVLNVAGGLPTIPRLMLRGATISPLPALTLGAGGLDILALGSDIVVGGNINSAGPVSLVTIDAITNPAGVLKAPSLNAQAADGLTLTLDGGNISATNGLAGNVTLSAVLNPPTLTSINPGLGVTSLASGSFRLGKTDAIFRTSPLNVGGALDLNGMLQGTAILTGAGSVTNSAPALSKLTLGVGDASGTFTGTISGHLALEKVGAGTQTIGGAFSAVDGTTITSGKLQFNALGSALDGQFTLSGGTLLYNLPAAAQSLSPEITLTANSSIGVTAGKTVTLTDLLTGPGGLTKVDAGTLILDNAQNSFGPAKVRINGGVLQVATDGALGDVGNDVEIDNATFAASASFGSGRSFSKRGGTATIDAQVPKLTLINQAIIPADLTPTIPANLAFTFTYPDTTTEPDNKITVGNTDVALSGGGTLIVHKLNPTTIDTIELTGTTSATKLVINAVDPNVVTTVLRVVINDPTPGGIASIGSIVLGKNVRLGDGVRDSVPELFVEGKVGSVQLYDVNSHAIVRLGESLPHGITGDKKTPSTKTNLPNFTIHEVLGPGVLIDLTPSDLPPVGGDLVGGGGLGKVVVDRWTFPGFIRTTQSVKSFKQVNGDNFVVFDIDKFHVGSDTQANVGSMTIQNGAWGSSGTEIEGAIGVFNANAFLSGATLTAASMGKFGLDAGAFAGTLTLTDPDAPGIPTFVVNGDFSGDVDSASPLRKINVKGDFTGELEAPFIGSITAYAFLGSNLPGVYNQITATDGALGTITATAGVVENFRIVTDLAFKGFNIKLAKLTSNTIGIDNVQIQAASIGNISVSLAADPTASGINLIGIRDSSFVTTGTGTTKTTMGSISNVSVTLAGATVGASASGILDSSFDALVTANEFGMNPASSVNSLGKITVKVTGQGGASVGLDGAFFSGNSIGATSVSVSKAASGTARAIDGAGYTATGAIGALLVDGDATIKQVHDLKMNAGTNIGAVTVKAKSTQFGTLDASAILAGQSLALAGATAKDLLAELAKASLGAVSVTGSITNSKLVAGGSIGAVSAGGSVTDSLVLAGATLGGDFAIDGDETYQRAASIASITVKGAFARTSLIAGTDPGDLIFGNAGDSLAPAAGILPDRSSIGPISLSAGVLAPISGSQTFAIQAAKITSLKLGSAPAALITNTHLLDLGPAGLDANDVIVRLVT